MLPCLWSDHSYGGVNTLFQSSLNFPGVQILGTSWPCLKSDYSREKVCLMTKTGEREVTSTLHQSSSWRFAAFISLRSLKIHNVCHLWHSFKEESGMKPYELSTHFHMLAQGPVSSFFFMLSDMLWVIQSLRKGFIFGKFMTKKHQ